MYVELHARSTFSFLRAGSSPEQLIKAASHLEVPRMALCDRDGFYGSVRHHMTGEANKIRALVGAELTMEDDTVVPLLVATREGYRGLSRLITTAKLRAPKGESRVAWAELAEASAGLFALTGDEEGPVLSGWRKHGPAGAAAGCARLAHIFGRDRLFVELQRHHVRGEDRTVRALRDLAEAQGLPLLATNGVSYATPADREVLDAFTCIRQHTHLDAAGRLLAANAERHLKTPAAMAALFADLPEAVHNTARLADQLEFGMDKLGYEFPTYEVPTGETMDSYLRKLVEAGARKRYDGNPSSEVRAKIDQELTLIAKLK